MYPNDRDPIDDVHSYDFDRGLSYEESVEGSALDEKCPADCEECKQEKEEANVHGNG